MANEKLQAFLKRQLTKHGLSSDALPTDLDEWQEFLQRVLRTYEENDQVRHSSENILDVSLREMERLQKEFSVSIQHKLELALWESVKNEKAFREVFENVPVGIIKLDKDLKFISANPAFIRMLGYSEAELLQLDISGISSSSDQAKNNANSWQAQEPGQDYIQFEKRFCHKNGLRIWTRVTTYSVSQGENGESYILGVVEDISKLRIHQIELKQAEMQKDASDNYLRVVLNSIQQGVWGLNLSGRTTFINQRGVELLGFDSEKEIIGQPMHKLVHYAHADGSPHPQKDCPMYDSFMNGKTHHIHDDVLWRKDGSKFPIAYYSAPIMMDGKCVGSVVSFEDLSETRKLEHDLELERQNSVRSAKFAALGELSAGIAHEVLILTETKSIKFNTPVTVEGELKSMIDCDEIEIEQVLINLISNAIDAVKDLKDRWVKVILLEEDSEAIVRIVDSGFGIPEEVKDKLFDPFFTTKKAGEGTGIGLSISKRILDEHKAKIQVLPGEHTCFEIRFPKVEPKSQQGKPEVA